MEVGRFTIYLGGTVDKACQEILMGTGVTESSMGTHNFP